MTSLSDLFKQAVEDVHHSSNGFVAFLTILKHCLTFEKKLSMEFRLKGFPCFRPSQIFIFLFMVFYITSPIDLLPEMWIASVLAYIDDAIVFAASLIYTLYDVLGVYASKVGESRGKSKK